jgi:hypothetical protein
MWGTAGKARNNPAWRGLVRAATASSGAASRYSLVSSAQQLCSESEAEEREGKAGQGKAKRELRLYRAEERREQWPEACCCTGGVGVLFGLGRSSMTLFVCPRPHTRRASGKARRQYWTQSCSSCILFPDLQRSDIYSPESLLFELDMSCAERRSKYPTYLIESVTCSLLVFSRFI